MAWIQKRTKKRDYKKYNQTEKNKQLQSVYNTTTWRKLRLAYLMENPLCEECLKIDKVTPAEEVHHIIPISKGETVEEMKNLAFDDKNLCSLCKNCHREIHKEMESGFLRKKKTS